MADTASNIATATPVSLEQQVRQKVESLSYLPTTMGVAMKFIELGNAPDAEPGDYAKVISVDASLSSRLLSLANSSWFGVRNKITKPSMAINLLGLSTVRTLAISYCLAGLHNDLDLSPEESKIFWNASLCKAVAAKQVVNATDMKRGEEAFAAALLQDFAMPIMYSVAKDVVLGWLKDTSLDWRSRLQRERNVFNLDHAEIGRLVAQKMDLPDFYVDAIAFHHDHARLAEAIQNSSLVDGLRLASVFPHCLEAWNVTDAAEAREPLTGSNINVADTSVFLDTIQKEYDKIAGFFEPASHGQSSLKDLLKAASRATADSTTRLVGTVHELMQQAIQAGKQVDQILQEHSRLEEAAYHDVLTGALNREGLYIKAAPILRKASRYGNGFAVIYMDLDKFKALNDTRGHAWGDAALKKVVDSLNRHVRDSDLVARLGGDEFVILLNDCGRENAETAIERLLKHTLQDQEHEPDGTPRYTLSVGFLWVQPGPQEFKLDLLITTADRLMYTAKRSGGNQMHKEILTADRTESSEPARQITPSPTAVPSSNKPAGSRLTPKPPVLAGKKATPPAQG